MPSTTNFCGADYPAAGIPQVTAPRWIGPDGTVTVDGNNFGRDVRPCNAAARPVRAQARLGEQHRRPGVPGRREPAGQRWPAGGTSAASPARPPLTTSRSWSLLRSGSPGRYCHSANVRQPAGSVGSTVRV